MIVAFVDEHRNEFGVEFICRQLQVAPSSYYAAKKRQTAPSARAVRDVLMMQVLLALWMANRKVYGAHKLWKAARRAGHDIGRDQVARLMRELGIEGVSRLRKKVFTTRPDPDAARAPDLVNRLFTADRPDALWAGVGTSSGGGRTPCRRPPARPPRLERHYRRPAWSHHQGANAPPRARLPRRSAALPACRARARCRSRRLDERGGEAVGRHGAVLIRR